MKMFGSKLLVGLLLVICCNHCHGVIDVVSKSKVFDDGIFFENRDSFNEGNLVYAMCDSNAKNVTNCKVVQETYPYEAAAYSCLVTLENNRRREDGSLSVTVTALGNDKAVLYWQYRETDYATAINIGTVDFKTCEMNRIKIPDSSRILFMELTAINKFVSYSDDSFDVFYQDPKRHPEIGELYKIQIDGNGKLISEPKSANVERGFFFVALSVANRSPAKGYVFAKRNQMRSPKDFSRDPLLYLLLVKPDGTTKQLAKYHRDSQQGNVAAGNNFISLCYKSKAKGHAACTQYDEDGNVRFTASLADSSGRIDKIKSYNLPNGGMLVMYGAKKCNRRKSYHKGNGYEVVWIGLDGKEKGRLCTQTFEIPKGTFGTPYIYANADKGYCATVIVRGTASEYGEIPVNFKIVTSCFTEDDFLA